MGRVQRLFTSRRAREMEKVELAFDPIWYRDTYLGEISEEISAWQHFLSEGVLQGNDPCPWFSVSSYLTDHPDVAAAGIPAFEHYVLTGRVEQRRIRMSSLSVGTSNDSSASTTAKFPSTRISKIALRKTFDPQKLVARLFDTAFYEATYPEILESGISAFDHYVTYGWREGRDPAPWFSTSFYVTSNPDVQEAQVEPFLHYISIGRREGRLPRDPLGGWRSVIAAVETIENQGQMWPKSRTIATMALDSFVSELRKCYRKNAFHRFSVIIGNDDYLTNIGGVQACVSVDVLERAAVGELAIYIWPAQPLPHLSQSDNPALRVRVGGKDVGTVSIAALGRALATLATEAEVSDLLTVHGLMGHNPASLLTLIDDATNPVNRVEYWAHDFFAACSCYTLAPYGTHSCGAPEPTSMRCSLCPYGLERVDHTRRVRLLLETPGTKVVAPSVAAAQEFSRVAKWKDQVQVRPIGAVTWLGTRREDSPTAAPLRIAFLGYSADRKGWQTFVELERWCRSDPNLELFHLGSEDMKLSSIKFVPVQQVRGDTSTMTQALLDHGIDIVLHWPTWHETFGITAHEAIAAGCLVLTNPESGNVAALAHKHASVKVIEEQTFLWLLRRGKLIPWLRVLRAAPTPWGAFVLKGLNSTELIATAGVS